MQQVALFFSRIAKMVHPVQTEEVLAEPHPEEAGSRGRQHHLTVEICGPAGAGKTGLSLQIKASRKDLILIRRFRKRDNLPVLLASVPSLISEILRVKRSLRPLGKVELHGILFLKLMHRLMDQLVKRGSVIVCDEGPVFMIAKMIRALRLGESKGINEREIRRQAQLWAPRLDMILYLDAPEEELTNRIRQREKEHLVKRASTEEIHDFIRTWREALDEACSMLQECGSVRVYRFDTSKQDYASIVREFNEAVDMHYRSSFDLAEGPRTVG